MSPKEPNGYDPVKTGWKRSEELDDDEIEQRGRVGMVITAVVLLLIIGYGLWRGLF